MGRDLLATWCRWATRAVCGHHWHPAREGSLTSWACCRCTGRLDGLPTRNPRHRESCANRRGAS